MLINQRPARQTTVPPITGAMSLYNQLESCLISSSLDDSPEFLPLSDLDAIITLDSIKAELPIADRWLHAALPRRIHEHAKKVFAILVLMQETGAIKSLICDDDISDEDLPLCRNGDKGDSEYNVLVSPGGNKTFNSFNKWLKECRIGDFLEKQWIVQAPILTGKGEHLQLDRKCSLPLTECKREAHGGSGVVYKSTVHPSHRLHSRMAQIAVKEFKHKHEFLKEKENLDEIKDLQHEHLIKPIATCEKGQTSYVMFPWADGGNLRDFWKSHDATPRTSDLFLWSLKQMLGIVGAIEALHDRNIRHGDIKPQNILHFTKFGNDSSGNERGIFIIADVGISKRHTEATGMRQVATSTREVTVSYEAPEAESDSREGRPRSRLFDMWSLGCLALEFTVWLVYNFKAVRSFRRWRTPIDEQTTAPGNFFTQLSQGSIEIHSAVSEAIVHLRDNPLCGVDTALGDLIQLIEEHLLQVEAEQRARAPELRKRLEAIVRTAEKNPKYLKPQVDQVLVIPDFFNRSSRHGSSSEPAAPRRNS
ncbi:hypothetical protein FDECE_13077 [Fusarium decemcellulare]|nr:hypothetical protein FDECE_13077 [Fusarium decemcellulare]